jgi:uncharacterized membrane protein
MKELLGFISLIGSIIFRGIVLSVLWKWFIVPLGVIEIGIFHAIGFSLLVTYLVFQMPSREISWGETIITSFVISLVVLLFGFIFHLFM